MYIDDKKLQTLYLTLLHETNTSLDISNIINDIQDYEESQMTVDQSGNHRWHNKQGQLHRRNGPAIESINTGYKAWYINGQRHREDGPAAEYKDGYKEWWLNGKYYPTETKWKNAKQRLGLKESKESGTKNDINISSIINDIQDYEESQMTVSHFGTKMWRNKQNHLHRRNGPGVEYVGGRKVWYLNGRRHRQDGPAVIYPDGETQWWLYGIRYLTQKGWQKAKQEFGLKESTDTPNISNIISDINEYEESQLKVDEFGNHIWRNKQGQFHRKNDPAVITPNGKKWFINDKLHRANGPAVEWSNGDKEWWINGKLHREDGPAIEHADGRKEWWLNGQWFSNNEARWKKAKQHLGLKESKESTNNDNINISNIITDINDYEESQMAIDGDGNTRWYNKQRQLHRRNGPAVVFPSGYKEWWINGKLHREDGPAVVTPDDGKGNGRKEWWINGKIHRENAPAVEYTDGSQEWWINGKIHREDGPAIEYVDGTKEWWLYDRRYGSHKAEWERAKRRFNKWKTAKQQTGLKESNDPNDTINISNIISDINEYEESQLKVDEFGTKIWTNKQGQYHRRNGPAYIDVLGSKQYFINGQLHRLDGPAVEVWDGSKTWALNGQTYHWKKDWEEAKKQLTLKTIKDNAPLMPGNANL